MKLCTVCWEDNCSHEDRFKVEIDENIAEIISILNKKGYRTMFCCGGHIYVENIRQGYVPNLYISFNKYNSVLSNIDFVKLGANWSWTKSNATLRYFMKEAKQYKGKIITQSDIEDMQVILNNQVNILKEYVKKLP